LYCTRKIAANQKAQIQILALYFVGIYSPRNARSNAKLVAEQQIEYGDLKPIIKFKTKKDQTASS
jgi:hypothetical protein